MAHGEAPVLDHFEGPIVPLIARIREAAHAAGKVAGLHGATAKYAIRMLSVGFNLVTPTSDIRLVAEGSARMVAEIAVAMDGSFGEKVHPVEDRLVTFLQGLQRERLIRMEGPDGGAPT